MKKLLIIFFILVPFLTQAQILNTIKDVFKGKPPNNQEQGQNSSTTNSGDGNQTILNLNESNGSAQPGTPDESRWREADWNLTLATMPALLIDQPGEQQFISNPSDAIDIGAHYKFSPRISIWLRYVIINAKGATLKRDVEAQNDDGETITEQEKYDTGWRHERIFWGLSWRFNFNINNSKQLQLGLGTSIYDDITETESSKSIGKLGSTIVLDIKYLWVTHNTSWGIQITAVETASKEERAEKYMKGGYLWFSAVVEIGFDGLNL